MPTKKRTTISAEDLYLLEQLSGVQLSPDGKHAIAVLQRTDQKTEKKYSNLWLIPTGRGAARQFTYGDHKDYAPVWSPDGKTIAFFSTRNGSSQIFLIPVHGGEARPLSELKGYIGNLKWAPDSSQLLFSFTPQSKDDEEREKDPQKKKLGVISRHIKRPLFKIDGAGFLPEEKTHLWLINAKTGKTTQLTDGAFDEGDASWSPDGKSLVYTSNLNPEPDFNSDQVDLFIIEAKKGTKPRKLDTTFGRKLLPRFSPDGLTIAYIGSDLPDNWWQNNRIYLVPVDGSSSSYPLTANYDWDVAASTLSDTGDRPLVGPVWHKDSRSIYFQVSRHGGTSLHRIFLENETATTVIEGEGVVGEFSFDAKQEKIAYFWGAFTDLGQVRLYDMKNGRSKSLTKFNQSWLRRRTLGEIEEHWYEGVDGNRLQGWILKPPHFDPTKKYPSILEIHGGPWLQYGYAFMHEFYYLAAQGYVVYFTNPRGGDGYGEEHAKAIHQNWGTADYADITAWVDFVSQFDYIDKDRMGITGGSYGGYLTLWAIGKTHRFKAAVAQRVVSNAISFYGSSDVGYLFENPWSGKPVWEDLDKYWAQSPMKYVNQIKTPTLLIHSEQDLRTPFEQGHQTFVALKKLGVDTELIVFPEESHGLSRIGRTDRRIVRLQHIKRWFDTYLS